MGFWELVRPVRGQVVAGTALQGLGALAALVPMAAIVELSGVLIAGGAGSTAWRWLLVAVGGVIARMALTGAGAVVLHFADSALAADLRLRLSAQLSRIPVGQARSVGSGRLLKLVSDDVAALHTLVAHASGDTVVAVVTAVGAFGLLARYAWPLALVALVPVLGFLGVFGAMMGRAVSQFDQYDEARGRLNAATTEFTRGVYVVKTFGRAGHASEQYARAVDDYARFYGRWMGPMITSSALGLAIVSAPSVLAVMGLSALAMVRAGRVDVTGAVAGLVLGIGLAIPLTQMDGYSVKLRAAREAAARIGAFLAAEPLPVDTDPVPAEWGEGGDVELREARLRYEPGAPEAVSGVSLHILPGTVTALVGPSGAGKSSCAGLIPRFWDPTGGRVLLAGTDLRRYRVEDLHRHVDFVLQDGRLLPLSLAENISLGRPGAGQQQVEDAARRAGIHQRICELPRGYDSVPGVDALLSGGESQRVAVARVLLAGAPVLLLDEATSYADPENEVLLQQALSTAARGRTVLVIAHRLAAVQDVDSIVVLDEGRVAQQGTHDELLDRDGLYRRLWRMQGAGSADPLSGPGDGQETTR
ncbi:AAA+ ATPase domain [Propionibacterium ruminifibrarum]|uniref:AAA+ ATPase domain n=1 Tax=Propionibacterium ruminifibrarum TaxID=1962131 RepID=A0A375I3P4_9ACTN|nr:ABC transporter ATP-binding protein [Propionibacterium ruminifibrarum]SPF68017.1 AAA+ ATPase domain [Propionibacterium ruminifibrarum]